MKRQPNIRWIVLIALAMGLAPIARAGLVEYHSFDTNFSDAYGRTTTAGSTATISSFAKYGTGSLYLDGTGTGNLALGAKAALNGLPAWTMSVWVDATTNSETLNAIFANDTFGNIGDLSFVFAQSADAGTTPWHLGVAWNGNYPNWPDTTSVPQVAPTGWFNLAVVSDGTNAADRVHLYINGVEEAVSTAPWQPSLWGDAAHLGVDASYGRSFTGYMDEFKLYDTALSGPDLQAAIVPEPNVALQVLFGGALLLWCMMMCRVTDRRKEG